MAMQSKKIRIAGVSIFVGVALIAVGIFGVARSSQSNKPVLGQMAHHDVSAPLKNMIAQPTISPNLESEKELFEENAPEREGAGEAGEEARNATAPKVKGPQATTDQLSQSKIQGIKSVVTRQMPAVAKSWDGVGANRYAPPDTSLDVSQTQILQVTNVNMQAWDKSGNEIMSSRPTNSIFSGFGGLCESTNDGDATSVYDRLNNRWVVSQFAVTGANGSSVPYLQCVAVSTTSDLLGTWYRYSFEYSVFPDYPKLAVWPGAYYTTFNGFGSSGTFYSGPIICAYDQAAMLLGNNARQACKTLSVVNDYSILVAGVEGSTPPPVGTSAYALELGTTSSMNSFRLTTNWSANPPALTVSSSKSIAVSNYAQACNGGVCITQSGTNNKLDSMGDRLMYRYVYRNLDGKASLLATHSVTSNKFSAIRWYEFVDSVPTASSTPTVYQQGTFDGADSTHRWMPSITSDKSGNIAIVYSTSSSSKFPSIASAGRLSTDTLGVMSQSELIIHQGLGSQTGTLHRWGDYSVIVADPADDCTFWASTEYLPANGSFNWATRILSFKYPSCGAPATVPPAPAAPTGVTGNNQVTLTITAPASSGGSAITSYKVSQSNFSDGTYSAVSSGTCTTITTAGTCTVTGLTNGTAYYFKVAAVNTAGTGAVSTASAALTPVGTALNPTFSTPVATSTGFTVNVTNYNALYSFTPTLIAGAGSATPGTASGSILPITVSGVTAGAATLQVATTRTGYAPGTSTISGNALPVISSISSTTTPRGAALTITGTNLWAATAVKIGSSTTASTKFTVLSPTSIIFNTATAATGVVSVTTPGGTANGASITVTSVISAPGSITMSASTGGPGTTITLTGTNLGATTAVVRGSKTVAFRVIANNQILLSIPSGLSTGTFTVTTPGGTIASPTYTASSTNVKPTVTSGAQTIKRSNLATISGANLGAITSLTINGAAVTDYTVTSATSITVRIPANATVGTSTIAITTPGGSVNTTSVTIN